MNKGKEGMGHGELIKVLILIIQECGMVIKVLLIVATHTGKITRIAKTEDGDRTLVVLGL